MLNYTYIRSELSEKSAEDINRFFEGFFVEENLKEYDIPAYLSDDEKEAIYLLFESDKPLVNRAIDSLKLNPLCKEALLIQLNNVDEIYAYYIYDEIASKTKEFTEEFTNYQRLSYVEICRDYIRFAMEINNYSLAEVILNRLCDVKKNTDEEDIALYSFIYSYLEQGDKLYDIYLKYGFKEIVPYILLIVALLKNFKEEKAKEVLHDMLDSYRASDYIDHIWDLDVTRNDELAFSLAIDACYEEICSLPYFFAWVKDNKDRDPLS